MTNPTRGETQRYRRVRGTPIPDTSAQVEPECQHGVLFPKQFPRTSMAIETQSRLPKFELIRTYARCSFVA